MLTRDYLVQKPLPKLFGKKLGNRAGQGANKPRNRTLPSVMISVIIPAHNEERYLGATLEALRRQTYGWAEIIVVANGCTDRTAEVARGLCHRLIVLSQKGLGVARNLGARMAKGEMLLFLDADTILPSDALASIAQEFSWDYAAGTLKGEPDNQRLKYKLLYGLKNWTHRSGFHAGSAGVILCWKKHFMKTGGFDERLEVRENSELIRRLCKYGKYKYIDAAPAITSMRRYNQRGCGRMIWLWTKLWVHSWFGDLHQRRYEIVR